MPALYAAAPRTSSRRPASRRVLTSSAIPWRRSRSGSVSSRLSSRTTRAGQWNAPTRFLPSGMSMPVLPPIAASTWPTSVVGTATHGTPRRYVAAANPATSVVQPPPRRDDRAAAIEAELPPEARDDRDRLRLLPHRQLVLGREPPAERLLRAGAVDPHHRAVGDERDRAVAGHELAEPVEAAALVVDACRPRARSRSCPRRSRRRPPGRSRPARRRGAGTRPRRGRAGAATAGPAATPCRRRSPSAR